MTTGTVYIAHAVDTEGPLYESLQATFERVYEHYGIRIPATRENLERLRRHEIDLNGMEEKVEALVAKDMTGRHLGTWDQIDAMHETVMSPEFRARFPDSEGNPYVLSWHCMDHVGFENNPRRRAMGYHAVFEHYRQILTDYDAPRDRIYWHFHPPSLSRDAHRQSCGFNLSVLHNEILARRIIDHQWFPAAHRPGGHYETYDINLWLEAWVPFDIAHQFTGNPEDIDNIHPIPGRFVDWRGAPTDWRIYHPDFYDHRKEGALKRWICRCLNLKTRYNNMDRGHLTAAFEEAREGRDVLVGVSNHDFRNMVPEIEDFGALVASVSAEFPDVPFRWTNVVEGFRAALSLPKTPPPRATFELSEGHFRLRTDRDIWGPQPFLALRTHEGRYYRDDFINDDGNQWTYAFDVHTIDQRALSHLGVAYNDPVGNTVVYTCDLDGDRTWKETVLNETDWI